MLEVLKAFLYLGLTSFGGPIAHLGYFRAEFVARRRWLDDSQYAQLLTLAQLLPGPASSQMGFSLGLLRAGWLGAIVAFIAFTLPSAVLLAAFAVVAGRLTGPLGLGVLHGLKLTAVCIVAHALLQMGRQLTPDLRRVCIAAAAAAVVLSSAHAGWQLAAIALGAALGMLVCRDAAHPPGLSMAVPYSRKSAAALLAICAVSLAVAIVASDAADPLIASVAAFFRAGALVFGGGHVVLPLLQESVVGEGLVTAEDFLAGYGAAQAVPGPMFSFAAYLGMKLGGPWIAIAAVLAIFLPGFLLVAGALPFWSSITQLAPLRAALAGINAAVVGVLAAAFYDPVCRTGIAHGIDVLIAAAGFAMLMSKRVPTLAVVAWCVLAGIGRSLL